MNHFTAQYRRILFTAIFSFFAFFVATHTSVAQCTIAASATATNSYTMVQSGGTNGMGVAYSPDFNVFYAAMGGSTGLPLETFNASGTNLFQATTGTDFRGIWWNPNDQQLEANGNAAFGIWRNDLNANGYALSTGNNPYTGQNQPDPASCGAYDCSTDEVIYYFNGSIYNYDRGSGSLTGSYALTGSPFPFSGVNSTSVGFTGCPGQEIALEDYQMGEILFFDKSTGAYAGESTLPVSATTSTQFNFSYAGDLAWLFDPGTRTWTGYQVLTGTPVAPIVKLGNDTSLCLGQTLTLDAGNAGATYLWQDGSTAETFTVTTAGAYSVAVNNGSCNVGRDTINVNYVNPPVINLGNDTTLCQGSSLLLTATTAGATYIWQNSSTNDTLRAATTGQYAVTVTTGVCSVADTINLTFTPPPVVNLGNDTAICGGGGLLLDATTAGATYSWQDGSANPTFNATVTGQYAVTVTVASCSVADTINIAFTSPPIVNLGNDTSVCPGNIVLLNATNTGATYLWQDNSANPTDTAFAAGTYKVTVTISGCTPVADSIIITNKPQPTVNLGNDTTICGSGNVLLNATTAGATYHWQDGSANPTLNATTSGQYAVTVTTTCPASDTINIAFTGGIKVNLGNDTSVCPSQPVTLDATTAGATYKWQDGSTNPTFNVITAGTYSVTVTPASCSPSADTIQVSYYTPPTVKIGNDTTLCQGQPLILDATTTGATYNWQDGSANPTFNATTTGNYAVTVTDVTGCTVMAALNATFNPKPVVNIGPDTALCNGQTITLDATSAGATYVWQDASTNPTFTVTAAGAYSVTVTANNCTADTTVNVTFNPPPAVSLGKDTILCPGQTLLLHATNANAKYQWQDGTTDSTYTITTAGTYSVTVTVGACPTATDDLVASYVNLTPPDLGPDTPLCPNQTITLDATTTGATAYLWQDGSTTAAITATQPGQYTVKVTSGACSVNASVNITQKTVPIVDLGKDTTICGTGTDSLKLNAQNPGDTYLWENKTTAQTLSVKAAGKYWVTVSNACGVGSDTVIITEKDCSCLMQVPNAFTPNNDGRNDIFRPYFNCTIVDFHMVIYDRWGEHVFTSEDISSGWDGHYKASLAPLGVYTWILNYDYVDLSGNAAYGHLSGDVTLLR